MDFFDSPTSGLKPVQRRRRFGTARTVIALMMREMQTTYGRSPGGYIWAIMEPVGGIALMSLVFSLGFRSPSLGDNFALFYATGVIPFLAYTVISGKIAGSLGFSRPLLSYPAVTYIDTIIARMLVNVLTQLMVGYLVFFGILTMFNTMTALNLEMIALASAMGIALSVGIGCINCFLFMQFPFWGSAWGILNRPMFLLSGVIFLYDNIPDPYRSYLWYNPLVHVIGSMRAGFYYSYEANYVSPTYVFGISLVCMVMGLVFLRRYHNDLLAK